MYANCNSTWTVLHKEGRNGSIPKATGVTGHQTVLRYWVHPSIRVHARPPFTLKKEPGVTACLRAGPIMFAMEMCLPLTGIEIWRSNSWTVPSSSSWVALQTLWALASFQFPDLFFPNRQDSLNEWAVHRKVPTHFFWDGEWPINFAQRPPWGLRFFNVQ
jgi:hypothetical protein